MIWAQIRRLYLEGTGNTAAAAEECYDHLSAARRRLCSAVETPELVATSDVTVASGADFVTTLPTDMDSVLSVFNKTAGIPCYPEPDGMLGRNRFLQVTTGKPPSGTVTHYFPDGAKLYVRDTASATTTLILRYRRALAAVAEADLSEIPTEIPERYHMALVHAAVSSYYSVHPKENVADPETNITLQRKAEASYATLFAEARPSYPDANKAVRHTTRLRGYSVRRWR